MNRTGVCALALGFAVAMPAAAVAAEDVGKWYVTPSLYGTWLSRDHRADDDWSYGVAVGRNFSDTFSLEAGLLRGDFRSWRGLPGDLRLHTTSLDTLFHFYRGSRIHPYLTTGLVYMRSSREGRDSDGLALVQAGFGVMSNLWTSAARTAVLSLRGELKGRWTLINEADRQRPADFLAGVGLQIAFGPAAPLPAMPTTPEPAPVEAAAAP